MDVEKDNSYENYHKLAFCSFGPSNTYIFCHTPPLSRSHTPHAGPTCVARIQNSNHPPTLTHTQSLAQTHQLKHSRIPHPQKPAPKYTQQKLIASHAPLHKHIHKHMHAHFSANPCLCSYVHTQRPRTESEGISSLMLHSCRTAPSTPPTRRRVMTSYDGSD